MSVMLQAAGGDVGMIAPFAMQAEPFGWLECNGAAVSRSQYSALFAAIGTAYGAGDGSTTFNLPDLRGEFIRGHDNGRGVDSGRVFGSAQSEDFKAHSHWADPPAATTSSNGAHNHTIANGSGGTNNPTYPKYSTVMHNNSGTISTSSAGNHTHTVNIPGFNVNNTGGSETRPRNVAMKYCIRYI